ncbi:MAG: hypothetical protein JNJ50_30765 [Acidobacteria bacterium]|nr:hypothetical protein [Acidobacteriota bacterium]
MKTIRLTMLFVLCLALAGISLAGKNISQGRRQTNGVELLPSHAFSVNYANVKNIGRQPHLEYRISNISGADIPFVKAILTAYDAKGDMLGRGEWTTKVDINSGSSTHAILTTNPLFLSAKRVTLQFTPLSVDESDCNDSFCDRCADKAGKFCKGGVKTYDCQEGSPCRCEFECFPPAE